MSETTTPAEQPQPTSAPPPTESAPESRQDLLSRAQAFLASPQIRDQDDGDKRKFLADKGLTPAEVDYLLQGIVSVWTPIQLRRFRMLMASVIPISVAVQHPKYSPTIVSSTATIEFTCPPRGRFPDSDVAGRGIYRTAPDILRT